MSQKVAAARFVDVALSKTGPLSLSYQHHHLKWLIRKDLLTLLRNFRTLSPYCTSLPSSSSTTLHLLAASGPLHLPSTLILTIILHPSHPTSSPLVFITSPSPTPSHHPFVDPLTGAATTPYLLTWQYPKSNLPDLTRNLVNIFTFWPINIPSKPLPTPSKTASHREAVDCLSMQLLSDVAAFNAATKVDMDALGAIKPTLSARAVALADAVRGLEGEEKALQAKVEELKEAAGELSEWLSSCVDLKGSEGDGNVEAFETVDEVSELMLEHSAADMAIDDAMNAAEKALGRDAVVLGEYLRVIRALAKEQFHHRNLFL